MMPGISTETDEYASDCGPSSDAFSSSSSPQNPAAVAFHAPYKKVLPIGVEPGTSTVESLPAGADTAEVISYSRCCKFLLIAARSLLVVLLVRTFIGEASVVPTASMERTILVGDHLFWDKALYGPEIPFTRWRLPQLKHARRGEIVAFRYPLDPSQVFLKRVAAVGGDRIEIRNGMVCVNGEVVRENYAVHNRASSAAIENMPARVVPPGALFMLGDNRDNSSDSRDWGTVPEENVIGSPLLILWSYDAPSAAWLDPNPGHRWRFYSSIVAHLFSHTRWSRMGRWL